MSDIWSLTMEHPIRPVKVFILRIWHEPGSGRDAWRGAIRPLRSNAVEQEVPFRDLDDLLRVIRLALERDGEQRQR